MTENQMKTRKTLSCLIYILIFTLSGLLAACQVSGEVVREFDALALTQSTSIQSCSEKPVSGCTVFTISKGEQVFFGGNDDYINPDSYYWVDQGNGMNYGAIWIGTPDNVQQGVNEKGLAYDANGLPRVDTNPHLDRIPVSGGYSAYPIRILHECATVEEVIEWVNKHQWHSYMHDQMQFADATGDAVIISAGTDGEVVFTRKSPGDGFLVSTNFNVANPNNGFGYPCQRYDTATKWLDQLISREGTLTAQDATAVLDAVHVEGGTSWTLESLVADLTNGKVSLYYFHQYDKPVVLIVADEIANPRAPGALSKLFPEEVRQEATRRYQQSLSNQDRCSQIGKAWIALVLTSLVLLIIFSLKNRRGWVFWLPVVIILGPLGLLVWLAAGRKQKASFWQAALVEAVGDVTPVTVAFMVMLAVFIFYSSAQTNGLLQVLFIFILPWLLGAVFFQGPLLALATRQGYLRTLGHRLLPALVAANLGMGGITLLASPLINKVSNTCSFMPLSLWSVVSLWTVVVAGACVAMLLLLLYQGWAMHRGFRAWSALAFSDDEVNSPKWHKLWWWFLLSVGISFGGVIVGQMIQRAVS
jgi:hypothetical protein